MNEEMISSHDVTHMTDIIAGYGDWFSAKLYRLIHKADRENRERIRAGFPLHVSAYENWERNR
jgi:hypothetical protein